MGIFDFGKKKKIYKQIIEQYKEETAKPCCEILLSDENEISILDDLNTVIASISYERKKVSDDMKLAEEIDSNTSK